MFKKYLDFLKLVYKIPFYYKNWWLVYLDYSKIIKHRQILYELRSGEKYWSRTDQFDIGILNEIYLLRVYDHQELDIQVRKNDIVLDAGGYIGDFTIYAAKRAVKGIVYVFEPSLDNFKLLKKNINVNTLKNVLAFQEGLYKESGKKTFYLDEKALGSSSLYSDKSLEKKAKKIIINVLGINEFIKNNYIKKIDYVKLDCEGAEFDIIYHTDKAILKKTRCLLVEYHVPKGLMGEKYTKTGLMNYLANLGFKVYADNSFINAELGYLYCRNMRIK